VKSHGSRLRTATVVSLAAAGVFVLVNALRAFWAIQQGGSMAGFGRDLGIGASVVGLLLVGAALLLWRR
jgi:hypothetical protein